MKKNKIKLNNVVNENQQEIIRFLKILLLIVAFLGIIYVFTQKVINKETNINKSITKGTINYDKIILGTLLNQNYDEYYVFVYDGNSKDAIYYSALIDLYRNQKDSIKIYWADLNNHLNKKFIANNEKEINKNAKNLNELKVGDYTLIKVSNKKIVKYIDTIESTKKELKIYN